MLAESDLRVRNSVSAERAARTPQKRRAAKLTHDAVKEAVATYLAEIQDIERAASRRKGEARHRLEMALRSPPTIQHQGPTYRGMLGSYFNANGRIPFVLLSVPNGENVLGEYARTVFNGRYDASQRLHRFKALGHVTIQMTVLTSSRRFADTRTWS